MDQTAQADLDNGKKIYEKAAKPLACKMCHGEDGDGMGKLGKALKPNPRNFTCSDTMKDVSAGQMFWIIKNGSPGTGMVAHGKNLKDNEIWDVVKYIRQTWVH
jgi:mono/diheme cytochrome c family protein